MPNLYIIYVLILLNITHSIFTKKRYIKMLNLENYLPDIIQYNDFLTNMNINNPARDYQILQKSSGMDMHMNESDESERQLMYKLIKYQYFSKLLNVLESTESYEYKLEEIQKNPFLEELSPKPVNLKSGGLFKNWEDDLLFDTE